MKSCMSTRRPACAPPPKIWICGIGSSVGSDPPSTVERNAQRVRRRVGRGHRHCQRCVRAEPRFRRRRVEGDQTSRARPGRLPPPHQGARDRAIHVRDRPLHVLSIETPRAVAHSRPRDSPRRTRRTIAARPRRRATVTSASTVGRPRLSHTRRAWMRSDRARVHRAISSRHAAATDRVINRLSEQGCRHPPHPFALRLVGDVLDRRFAIDTREKQSGQQPAARARFGRGSQSTPAGRLRKAPRTRRKRPRRAAFHRHLSSR